MQTSGMKHLYQQIADTIVEMIPEEWSRVLLYAQVNEESAIVYFYYFPKGKDAPEYSLDIARKWDVPAAEYNALEKKLYDLFIVHWREASKQGLPAWTNLTLRLDRSGSIEMDYDASDKENNDAYEDLVIWKYRNLNMKPDSSNQRDSDIIRKYIKSL